MRITIIGIGGIGSHLADWIACYLDNLQGEHTLTLVDGDVFEDRNRERQSFEALGNKAQSVGETLAKRYARVAIHAVAEYLTPENADFILLEGEVVFLCVDNHRTRKLASDAAGQLNEIVLISGGNELVDGNAQVYLRRNGVDVKPPLTMYHPEIAFPADKAPYEKNCEELARAGEPQILFTNLTAGVLMANAFRRLMRDGTLPYSEVFFDTDLNAVRTRDFAVKTDACLDQSLGNTETTEVEI